MKEYIIKLEEDLSNIYEDLAKMNNTSAEECMQVMLKKVIDTLLGKHKPNHITRSAMKKDCASDGQNEQPDVPRCGR